jgi:hypothetical protein
MISGMFFSRYLLSVWVNAGPVLAGCHLQQLLCCNNYFNDLNKTLLNYIVWEPGFYCDLSIDAKSPEIVLMF